MPLQRTTPRRRDEDTIRTLAAKIENAKAGEEAVVLYRAAFDAGCHFVGGGRVDLETAEIILLAAALNTTKAPGRESWTEDALRTQIANGLRRGIEAAHPVLTALNRRFAWREHPSIAAGVVDDLETGRTLNQKQFMETVEALGIISLDIINVGAWWWKHDARRRA